MGLTVHYESFFFAILDLIREPLFEYCTQASILVRESQDPSGT